MNTFKYGRVSVCEGHYREVPVSALGNIAINGWLDVVWHLRIGETRALEERAIERWENEGGEIPNEQRKRTRLFTGKSMRPSTIHEFTKAIII